MRSALPITVDKQPLAADDKGVREQVRRANQMRYNYDLDELQQLSRGC
jgi:hypothetical protein